MPPRVDAPLPLRIERSPTELRIEAQATLLVLARKLRVDAHPSQPSYGDAIDRAAHELARARAAHPPDPVGATRAWVALASLVWQFDAHVQDQLTAVSDTQACGYQLGRGLAECYWALDLASPKGWGCWQFLFDAHRCAELTRLMGRLSGYLQDFSASAIAGSLEVWKLLAGDEQWRRQPTVQEDLYSQIRNWYELLVLNQDASRLVQPYHLLRNWRVTVKAIRTFLPQLLLGAAGLVALLVFIFAIGEKHPERWVEALASVLSAVGLSTAGLTAKLKNETQVLSTRLQQDAYTDLLATSITTVPDLPGKRRFGGRQAVVERTVSTRTLTPSTPLT